MDKEDDAAGEKPSVAQRIKHIVVGKPRDLADRSIFHHLSLVPFLAWVGMGADGLSSSAYGPEEAFRTLGQHTFLAVGLAGAMVVTVFVIAIAYSRVIEQFPHGGGGYVVATKVLGPRAGVVSGSALLVDYILTITVSVAAAGDAIFSLAPHFANWKLAFEVLALLFLITLNLRGVRESILVLLPIFLMFVITHLVVIGASIFIHAGDLPRVGNKLSTGFHAGRQALGWGGMMLLFLHAYSMGGGTYTGIEAVSNGLPILRDPKVENGKRTMFYMAISLAFTASGLLLCYLLLEVKPHPDKTMNAVLIERFFKDMPFEQLWIVLTLLAEGALLFVAAQTGFIDGPRVLANMAVDSWIPRRFAALSERLTTQNGVLVMGATSLAALVYTGGSTYHLVIMYSINVFLTFSMTESSMCKMFFRQRRETSDWKRKIWIHVVGLTMCATILCITVFEKFGQGGWVTLLVTGTLVVFCSVIHHHYSNVATYLKELDLVLDKMPETDAEVPPDVDPTKPTAAVLVASYGGLGIHTVLNIFRAFPGHFKNLVFIGVGVTDSGQFKGEQEMKALKTSTRDNLEKYVELSRRLGIPATYRWAIATDAVAEAERLCLEIRNEFHKTVFFAGQVIFQLDKWYHHLLHNHTAFAIQKRLQLDGITMVILPVRVRGSLAGVQKKARKKKKD